MREAAEKKKLHVKQEVSDDVPVFVVGDKCRVRRVVCILIDNAIKFTESYVMSIWTFHQSAHGGICFILCSCDLPCFVLISVQIILKQSQLGI